LQTIASTPADALAVIFGAPTIEQQRAKIRRHKGLNDEFSVECIRLYLEKRQGRQPWEADEAFEALRDMIFGLQAPLQLQQLVAQLEHSAA
jgi:hypothetical protein